MPIVKLGDWFLRDGLDILSEQEIADQYGKLKGMLKQANLDPVLIESVPLESIAEVQFPLNLGSKPQQKKAADFRTQVQTIRELESIIHNESPRDKFEWFKKNRQHKIEEIVKRLSRHLLSGYYFLERVDANEKESPGYVCLLREVASVPRTVAQSIGRGLSLSQYQDEFPTERQLALSFEHDDLAMPVSEISSPTIEHILQMFAFLFTRIGIEDPVEKVIDAIIGMHTYPAEHVEQ